MTIPDSEPDALDDAGIGSDAQTHSTASEERTCVLLGPTEVGKTALLFAMRKSLSLPSSFGELLPELDPDPNFNQFEQDTYNFFARTGKISAVSTGIVIKPRNFTLTVTKNAEAGWLSRVTGVRKPEKISRSFLIPEHGGGIVFSDIDPEEDTQTYDELGQYVRSADVVIIYWPILGPNNLVSDKGKIKAETFFTQNLGKGKTKFIILALTKYDRAFMQDGVNGYDKACNRNNAIKHIARSLQNAQWLTKSLRAKGVPIYCCPTSVYGFVRDNGAVNLDLSTGAVALQTRSPRYSAGDDHQPNVDDPYGSNWESYWEPFLASDPFLLATLCNPPDGAFRNKGLIINFEEVVRHMRNSG